MDLALLASWALLGPTSATEGVSWHSLGLIACLVGCFLLANGVVLRDPRTLVAQRFARSLPPLRSARELVFHRVQTGLGFLFLIAGFALQLARTGSPEGAEPDLSGSIALWVGGMVVLAILLEGLGWWWSLFAFRRHVRAFLRESAPDLAADVQLARELGELFGVRSHAEDTVQTYLDRLRARIGVGLPVRPAAREAGAATGLEDPHPPAAAPPPSETVARGLPRLR